VSQRTERRQGSANSAFIPGTQLAMTTSMEVQSWLTDAVKTTHQTTKMDPIIEQKKD
jgi:hypothetical protein